MLTVFMRSEQHFKKTRQLHGIASRELHYESTKTDKNNIMYDHNIQTKNYLRTVIAEVEDVNVIDDIHSDTTTNLRWGGQHKFSWPPI